LILLRFSLGKLIFCLPGKRLFSSHNGPIHGEEDMQPFAHRRETLSSCLVEEALDCLLISNPINVSYLTNFSGETSSLLLGKNRSLLVSDARFTEQLAEECPGLETFIRPPTQRPLNAVGAMIDKLGYRNIGFESAHVTVAELDGLRQLVPAANWKGATDRVETLRAVKDEHELQEIRQAITIAEKAFTVLCALIGPDDTEQELCDALESYLRKAGGKGASFPSIIASGARAALPHAPPTGQRVGEAELLLIDWGAAGRFYKSDLTRVVDTRRNGSFVGDGSRLESIHAVVRKSQLAALAAVRPGVKAHDVDAAARKVLGEAGYSLDHGLGHGIGLQVHEAPGLRPNSETLLVPGMVITIEPGVYVPGWGGIRIEDDVLVTSDGCEVLSHLSRDLTPVFGP
jgi:Xaa-Pro aminopeptidase